MQPRTHQATQKSDIQPSRRQKPEPQHKVSSATFKYACGQTSPPEPIYHKQSDLKSKGSTQVALQNSKKSSTDAQKEVVADKVKRRELSFAETCSNDGNLSPQKSQKRKQTSTPYARAIAAAAHKNPATLDRKRSIGANKIETTLHERVAVIPNSPLQNPSKRVKLALKVAVQRDHIELEQKSPTSRTLPTAIQRDVDARLRQTEAHKSVNFPNPFEVKKQALRLEETHSDYSLPQQSSQSASDTSSFDYLSPNCVNAPPSTTLQRKSSQDYGTKQSRIVIMLWMNYS